MFLKLRAVSRYEGRWRAAVKECQKHLSFRQRKCRRWELYSKRMKQDYGSMYVELSARNFIGKLEDLTCALE